ncbi:Succinyl-CoA:3-ketoacid coenzyme A transferase subunit B [compost metagenome]
MEHTARNEPKIVKQCTLPLTGAGVVDLIITDLCVFEVSPDGLTLVELAPEISLDDVRSRTEANFSIAPDLGEKMLKIPESNFT